MSDTFEEFISFNVEEFSKLDLVGRPFLSQQGRAITRGIVSGFRFDETNWYLDLIKVDYLNRETLHWERRYETDEYTSDHSMFGITYGDSAHTDELHLEIGGYGFTVFLGEKSDAPWTTFKWANVLHTDLFNGGILGEDKLPG